MKMNTKTQYSTEKFSNSRKCEIELRKMKNLKQ
jgi:hypothetical protein